MGFKREKNWGFVEEEGALMVYYALLPCTVVLEYDMGQPDGVILRSRACYDDQAAIIQQQTGKGAAHCIHTTSCTLVTLAAWQNNSRSRNQAGHQPSLTLVWHNLQGWTS